MNAVGSAKFDYYLKNGEVIREEQKKGAIPHFFQRFFGALRGRTYDRAKVAEQLYALGKKGSVIERRTNRLFLEEVFKDRLSSRSGSVLAKVHDLVDVIFSQKKSSSQCHALQALGPDGERVLKAISKKLPQHSDLSEKISEIRDKVSVLTTWRELSMDPSVIDTDFESVNFLVKQRLLYSIVGLHNSSSLGNQTPPFTVREGKIYMLQDGVRVPVHSLIKAFQYDSGGLQLIDVKTRLPWNYLLPKGLVQIDRCSANPLVPVTQLNRDEMKRLVDHAMQLEGASFLPDEPATCVFQFCTNPRPIKEVPDSPFLDGIHALAPVHVGFRVINENGDVYSSGFAASPEEGLYRTGTSKIFSSVNGLPAVLDYEEFRPHDGRLVTSVPMTKKQCDDIIYKLNTMRKKGVRFNILTQNCSYMATEMAEVAGVHIEHKLKRPKIFEYLFPHFSSFPPLNYIVKKVSSLSERISKKTMLPSIGTTVGAVRSIIDWAMKPVNVLLNGMTNLALLAFGAGAGSPIKKGLYGEKPGEHMKSFYSLIQSPKDIFSDDPSTVYHSGPIIAWQQQQKTTCSTPYTVPIMNIMPTSLEDAMSDIRRPFRRFDSIQ